MICKVSGIFMMKQQINGISVMQQQIIFLPGSVIGFCIAGNIESDCLSCSMAKRRRIKKNIFPFSRIVDYMQSEKTSDKMNFVMIDCYQ